MPPSPTISTAPCLRGESLGPLFDLCERKHGGHANSRAAHARLRAAKREKQQQVLDFIRSRGAAGATVDEVAAAWGVGQNAVSGRFTELKEAGHIWPIGKRPTRGGNPATVYRTGENQHPEARN